MNTEIEPDNRQTPKHSGMGWAIFFALFLLPAGLVFILPWKLHREVIPVITFLGAFWPSWWVARKAPTSEQRVYLFVFMVPAFFIVSGFVALTAGCNFVLH